MDFELLGSLGWREGLIAIIVLLLLYIVVLFLRMRRLQHARRCLPPLAAQSAVAAYTAIQEPVAPALRAEPAAPVDARGGATPARPVPAWRSGRRPSRNSPGTNRRRRFPGRR
jgi:hypothetical protein